MYKKKKGGESLTHGHENLVPIYTDLINLMT